MQSYPPEWLSQYATQIGADLTVKLIELAGGRLRRALKGTPYEIAVRDALTEGVSAAVQRLSLDSNNHQHILGLFSTFVTSRDVLTELKTILEPNPQQPPDLELLRVEFEMAGFDASTLPGSAFDDMIRSIIFGFYNAAAHKPELQGVLQLQQLGHVVDQLGTIHTETMRIAEASERTATASERTAGVLEKQGEALKLLTSNVLSGIIPAADFQKALTLITQQQQFALQAQYQALVLGLRESNRSVIFDPDNRITGIESYSTDETQHASSAAVDALRQQVQTLLQRLDAPARDTSPQEFSDRENRYRQGLFHQFEFLSFEGQTNDVRPLKLPLENVYVKLRAVAEVPEAADAFSPEEKRLIRTMEEEGGDGRVSWTQTEKGREMHLKLDAARRERWTHERLETFPIAEALRDDKRRGLVILGDPGSGKSTLLHFLALAFAQGPAKAEKLLQVTGVDADRLPIYVPLAAYDELLRLRGNERPLPASAKQTRAYLTRLRKQLVESFSLSELEILCHDVDVRFDSLSGDTLQHKSLKLIERLEHLQRVADLVTAAKLERPDEVWEQTETDLQTEGVLTEQNDSLLTVKEFLARYYARYRDLPGLGPVFEQALATGKALVLLDGLDEVVDDSRRQFVSEQVSAFVNNALALGNRVIVTSRIFGYRVAPLHANLPHITVLDFRKQDIQVFADRWYDAFIEWDFGPKATQQQRLAALRRKDELLADIGSNEGVERLAVNPLLLTMLTLLGRQIGRLPQRRIKLYDRYVEALIQNWEERRTPGVRTARITRIDFTEAENALLPLSLWLQENKPSGTVTKAELMRQLEQHYARELGLEDHRSEHDMSVTQRRQCQARAQNFLEDMRKFSGMLIERGSDAFGFRHLTFQEYFAGRALAVLKPDVRWAKIAPNLHDNRWREPIQLCAGRLGVSDSRSDEASDLVQQILDARSEQEDLLYRDLFLAADCALDDLNLNRLVLRNITDKLRLLLDHKVPLVANGALLRTAKMSGLQRNNERLLPEAWQAVADKLNDSQWNVRSAVVAALAPLIAADAPLRAAVADKLNDDFYDVRSAVVAALAPLIAADAPLRAAVADKLNDSQWNVRSAVVAALAPLIAADAPLRAAVADKLNDSVSNVRSAVVAALAPLIAADAPLRAAVADKLNDSQGNVRSAVVAALAPLIAADAPLRAAVADKLNDSDNDVRSAVVAALAPLIAADAPLRAAVADKLNDSDNDVRSAVVAALAPLIAADAPLRAAVADKLNDSDNDVRSAVVAALIKLTPLQGNFDNKIRQLLEHRDWTTRRDTLKVLADTTQDETILVSWVTRQYVNEACIEAGTGRSAVVAALAPLIAADAPLRAAVADKLNDSDNDVRSAVVAALAPLIAADAPLRAAVADKLNDDFYDVRSAVVAALAPLIAADAPLRAAVADKLNDSVSNVRSAVVAALAPLIAADAPLRAAVADKLNDSDNDVRSAVVAALAPLIAADAPLRAAVADKLNDSVSNVRSAVVAALAPLIAADAPLRAAVADKLNDSQGNVRRAVVAALAPLIAADAPLRAAVADKLNDSDNDVRSAVVAALAPLIAADAPLRAAVADKLNDSQGNVRSAVVAALAPLIAADAPLRAAVADKLNDSQGNVRSAVVAALAPLIAADAPLRAAVADKLNDSDNDVRSAVVAALAPLIAADAPLRAAVADKLNDSDNDVRSAVVAALAPLIAADAPLRAAVADKLNDSSASVRSAVVAALAPLIAADAPLRAAVADKLNDSDNDVRSAVVAALAPLIAADIKIRQMLEVCLNSDEQAEQRLSRYLISSERKSARKLTIDGMSVWVRLDAAAFEQVLAWLGAADWRRRGNAAEILAGAGEPYVRRAIPQLLLALNDHRGLDAYRAHIAAAELVLNHVQDGDKAMQIILPALDVGTHRLVAILPAVQIREQAAIALGKLKAAYRHPIVVARLCQVLDEESNERVLDAAYTALLSLVSAPELTALQN